LWSILQQEDEPQRHDDAEKTEWVPGYSEQDGLIGCTVARPRAADRVVTGLIGRQVNNSEHSCGDSNWH
jgi:hypothetical protein